MSPLGSPDRNLHPSSLRLSPKLLRRNKLPARSVSLLLLPPELLLLLPLPLLVLQLLDPSRSTMPLLCRQY
jgi:hypothetical protein